MGPTIGLRLVRLSTSLQESTGENPFLLLYGRTPEVPSDAALQSPVERMVNFLLLHTILATCVVPQTHYTEYFL